MADNHVGCLVITKWKNIVGILTERDLLVSLAERGRDLAGMKVADIMHTGLVVCTPNVMIGSAVKSMKENKIKQLPVVENDVLVGIVTASDIVRNFPELHKELHSVIRKGGSL